MQWKQVEDSTVMTTDAGQELGLPAEAWDALRAAIDDGRMVLRPARDQDGKTTLIDDDVDTTSVRDQPQPLFYGGNAPDGPNPNAYLSVQFEDGQVMIRRADDPTGYAFKVPNDEWQRFTEDLDGAQADQPPPKTGKAAAADEPKTPPRKSTTSKK
jgi:hypothetical protein